MNEKKPASLPEKIGVWVGLVAFSWIIFLLLVWLTVEAFQMMFF